jgi:hypothetical protein
MFRFKDYGTEFDEFQIKMFHTVGRISKLEDLAETVSLQRSKLVNLEQSTASDISELSATLNTMVDRVKFLEEEISTGIRFKEYVISDVKQFKDVIEGSIKKVETRNEDKRIEIEEMVAEMNSKFKRLESEFGISNELIGQ